MLPEILDLAATQHGLVTRRQLAAFNVNRNRIARWVRAGRLRQVDLNTFAIGGVPTSDRQEVLAAVLETGLDASASHTTAAALWGLSGYRLRPVHVVVCRASRQHLRLTGRVHQFTGKIEDHRTVLDSIPVTSPALTMLHLASIVSLARLERTVDNAWSLGILTGTDLAELDAQLAQRGRDGLVALRNVASVRGEDWVPPQSNIEARFDALTRQRGLEFRRQVRIDGEGWSARVDFLHDESRTIVEVQSERYHTALTDVEADKARRERLEKAGYTVIEVWDGEIFEAPHLVIQRVVHATSRTA